MAARLTVRYGRSVVRMVIAGALAVLPSVAMSQGSPFVEGQRVLGSATTFDQFGVQVAVLDDQDGDGIRDFAVGTLSLSPLAGSMIVHSGADAHELRRVVPLNSATTYASSIAFPGDVNDDGIGDIAVGSSGGSHDFTRGAVRIYSGADDSVLVTMIGQPADRLGSSLDAMGDVDGDGAGDLVAGGQGGRGRVFLLSGRTGAILKTWQAPADARGMGWSVARLDDVDGDGLADVVAGAPAIDTPGPRYAFVFSSMQDAPLLALANPGDSEVFGSVVRSAGDYDRDGRGDFIVADGAFGGSVRTGGRGRLIVASGANGATLLRLEGSVEQQERGREGISADLDGDGRREIFVAERAGGAANAGAFSVLAPQSGAQVARYTYTVANSRFANRLAVLDDVDGDGALDILATTFGAAEPKVFVVAGTIARGAALQAPSVEHSGLWFDQGHAGEGFVLELIDATHAVVYFFTYTATGAQRWFAGNGEVHGNRIVFDDLYDARGGRLGGNFDPADVQLRDRSRLVLWFDGCDRGGAEYLIDGVLRKQRLLRLTRLAGSACGAAARTQRDWSGSWYDAAHAGEGWIVQSVDDTQHAVITWFTYGDDGLPAWLIGNAVREGNTLVVNDLVRPVGGRFGDAFDPADVTHAPWGTLRLQFTDCGHGTAQWTGTAAGSAPLVRLTTHAAIQCTATP